MRPLLLSVASLPLLAAAHSPVFHRHERRQAPPSASSSSISNAIPSPIVDAVSSSATPPPSPSSSNQAPATTPPAATTSAPAGSQAPPPPPASSSTNAPGVTTSVVAPPAGSTPITSITFTLASTNPTAVPLSNIVATAASSVTRPLDTTFAPGTQPTFLPGAPPLPNAALLVPSNYPPLDHPPPTDSPEVQQWIKDVADSGVPIPDIPPTVAGGCPANLAAAADTNRCWWTCGGCTRPSDVTECPTAMTWGLTYDDGPSFYTSDLLHYLDEQKLKSTFFVVGSRVISFPQILQTQYMDQHQISVHTWSHPSLTTLTNEEIIAELGWSKKVIKDVLGVTPNTMRPPYGDIDDRVRAISLAMGLTPIMWTRISPMATFDTDDFNIHAGTTTVQQVLQNWENILGNVTTRSSGFIVLEHDLFQQTVEVATGYILPDALAHKPPFTIQPVVTCLNKPLSDAYIETNNNKTNPPAQSAATFVTGATTALEPSSTSDRSSGSSGAVLLRPDAGFMAAIGTTVVGFLIGLVAVQA